MNSNMLRGSGEGPQANAPNANSVNAQLFPKGGIANRQPEMTTIPRGEVRHV